MKQRGGSPAGLLIARDKGSVFNCPFLAPSFILLIARDKGSVFNWPFLAPSFMRSCYDKNFRCEKVLEVIFARSRIKCEDCQVQEGNAVKQDDQVT